MSIKRSYTLPTIFLVSMILSGLLLSSSISYATDTNTSQDNVSVNVPVSCTMNGTGMTSHNANIPNGTYQADIGTTTLKTFCNDNQGFAIYAIGYTNEEYGNTNLVGLTQNQTIITGTATTTGNPDVSNWAVKLATNSGATYPLTLDNSFGSYHNVPTTYTKVAHRDSGTDLGSSATGASLTTTYAAYISKTQAADTYNGKVKYTLVHPASEVPPYEVAGEAGKVSYNTNSNIIVGQMGGQTVSDNASVTLLASNFKREGYGFAGWNDKFDYSGTTYGPQETIITPADVSTNGLPLYAVWVPSAGTMQDWNDCLNMNIGDVTALTDSRDNDTYAIAKLADGKCWMIENLRLDDSVVLSSSNTNNPSLPLTNIYDTSVTSNHLSSSSSLAYNATIAPEGWCTVDSSACNDQSRLRTDNTTLFTNNTASAYSADSNVYSYGNYYNWYSATAGHGKYGSSYGVNYHAPGDVCPAGWHLPTGGDATDDFNLLDNALGAGASSNSNQYRSYPNNFVYSGNTYSSSVSYRNSSGSYWSSDAASSTFVGFLYYDDTYVGAAVSSVNKYYGFTVRCVFGV